jgi:hypothetical protein
MTQETTYRLRSIASFLGGLALGAGLMYARDPHMGRRRRALARDKAVHYRRVLARRSIGKAHDLRNRAKGRLHDLREQISAPRQAS